MAGVALQISRRRWTLQQTMQRELDIHRGKWNGTLASYHKQKTKSSLIYFFYFFPFFPFFFFFLFQSNLNLSANTQNMKLLVDNVCIFLMTLVRSGSNKIPQTGWFKQQNFFSCSSGGWKLKPKCQQVGFLRNLSLACRRPSSCCVFIRPISVHLWYPGVCPHFLF